MKNISFLFIILGLLSFIACNKKKHVIDRDIVDTLVITHKEKVADSLDPYYLEKVDSSEFYQLSYNFPTSKDTSVIDTARVKWKNDTLYIFPEYGSYYSHPNSKYANFEYITFYNDIQCWLIKCVSSEGEFHYSLIQKKKIQKGYLVCFNLPLISPKKNYVFSSGTGHKAEDLRIYKNDTSMLQPILETDLKDWSVIDAKWYNDTIIWLKRRLPKKNELNNSSYDVDYVQLNLFQKKKK